MFYRLIQLLETNIYFGNDTSSIYSRLLLINLGFQGLVFFILMSNLYEINNFYIIICSIISIYIIFEACKTDFNKANITPFSVNIGTLNFYIKIKFILLILYYIYVLLYYCVYLIFLHKNTHNHILYNNI